jgi:hypothetical protein
MQERKLGNSNLEVSATIAAYPPFSTFVHLIWGINWSSGHFACGLHHSFTFGTIGRTSCSPFHGTR